MKIQFFMPMIPPTVTAQEHKVAVVNGKPRFYDPPEVADAKSKLTAALAKHCTDRPFSSAVRLVAKWLFPVSGKHKNGDYKTTRPDTDNLQKMLKDCMTKCGFWKDDALVASEISEKFWADVPGIWISIEEL
ncbi:MAG: RusA family crossover junction endodeoxyribonuclease [Oscillospiraceae bacterium]|nr:RusA family crossover junction endodeoxyribonuclease [Oscillospiraceae bacterium]